MGLSGDYMTFDDLATRGIVINTRWLLYQNKLYRVTTNAETHKKEFQLAAEIYIEPTGFTGIHPLIDKLPVGVAKKAVKLVDALANDAVNRGL